MPSECGAIAPVAIRSESSRVEWMMRPPAAVSSRSRTRPNSLSWASGLERYSRREMSDSGAPASTSAADTARVRGVAFGWANVAVSMTIPAISSVARAPSPSVSGAPSRAASNVTISQVAALPGSIQSFSPTASFEA